MASSTSKIDKLTRHNYDTWAIHMECILTIAQLWEIVTGEEPKPDDDGTNSAEIALWVKRDKEARARLLLTITAAELKQIKGEVTSHDIWMKLQSIFADRTPVGKMVLLKELFSLKLSEKGDPKEFLDSFFERRDKLVLCDLKIPSEVYSTVLTLALPPSYDGLVCAMESRDELPPPDDIRLKVLNQAKSRQIRRNTGGSTSTTTEEGAMVASGAKKKGKKSKAGGSAPPPPKKQEKAGKFPFACFKCGKTGHRIADCKSLSAGTAATAEFIDGTASPTDFAASFSAMDHYIAMMSSEGDRDAWIIDTGATSHMTSYRDAIEDYQPKDGKLHLAGKSTIDVTGKGTTHLTVHTGKAQRRLPVTDVLHVPDLRTNLLSVAKMTDKRNVVIFTHKEAIVLDQQSRVIARTPRQGDLYIFHDGQTPTTQAAAVATTSDVAQVQLWHKRFGHLNAADLKAMSSSKRVAGMNLGKCAELPTCKVCVAGKATVKPFPKASTQRTKTALEIVHSDICGPMRTTSNGGRHYFITFTDDHS